MPLKMFSQMYATAPIVLVLQVVSGLSCGSVISHDFPSCCRVNTMLGLEEGHGTDVPDVLKALAPHRRTKNS